VLAPSRSSRTRSPRSSLTAPACRSSRTGALHVRCRTSTCVCLEARRGLLHLVRTRRRRTFRSPGSAAFGQHHEAPAAHVVARIRRKCDLDVGPGAIDEHRVSDEELRCPTTLCVRGRKLSCNRGAGRVTLVRSMSSSAHPVNGTSPVLCASTNASLRPRENRSSPATAENPSHAPAAFESSSIQTIGLDL
jgi:hypothetical protein